MRRMATAPTGAADAREPEGRREAILAAACRVIARDGAHGLHMSAVAREAGVSKALIHYYVATRRELIERAIGYADARAREAVEGELRALPTGRARLERLFLAYATNAGVFASSHALWSAAWGSLAIDEAFAPFFHAGYRGWLDWIVALLEEGRRDGSIRVPFDPGAATRLAALAEGLSSLVEVGVVSAAEAETTMREGLAALDGGGQPSSACFPGSA
ncbi:MAG: TetR/AcrR family transcriptional regulator [Thermoleophilia bacterium]|nr:TetR/AcrR family transcriptional regulator [Thermoleophilia bacterium]